MSKNNTYAPSGQSTPQSFENYPGIFYLGDDEPVFTNSVIMRDRSSAAGRLAAYVKLC